MGYHRSYYYEAKVFNVLIADDNPVERIGIKAILEGKSCINIIGETGCNMETVAFVRQQACDLVVADMSTTNCLSGKIIKNLKRIRPMISILVMGRGDEVKDVVPMMHAGADGYFRKTESNEELLQAIRTITWGERYLPPDMAEHLGYCLDLNTASSPHELLSLREREVMLLMSTGKTVTEVSKELSLNIKTISTYKSRIFEKLKISSNADLILYAFQNHLVEKKIGAMC